jgi:hypothetical protein
MPAVDSRRFLGLSDQRGERLPREDLGGETHRRPSAGAAHALGIKNAERDRDAFHDLPL